MQLDAYLRQSRTHEGSISIAVQREKIENWAKSRDVELLEWHEDVDVSGGTLDRPSLNRLLERIRSGETGGIAVARLDRLSRASVVDALRLVEEIHGLGGHVAAVDFGLDPTTPFGEFGMTLFLGLARMQRRQIAESWDDARSTAIVHGAVPGKTPFGYRRSKDPDRRGVFEPDPNTAPLVQLIFRMRADGQSLNAIKEELARRGHRRGIRSIGVLLKNDTYLGHASSGDYRKENAHKALVPTEIWQQAQGRAGKAAPSTQPKGVITGLVRCAGCRYVMTNIRDRGRQAFMCRARHLSHSCECPSYISDKHGLEDHVVENMFTLLGRLEAHASAQNPDLEKLDAAVEEAERMIEVYSTDPVVQKNTPHDVWIAGLEARGQALERARQRREQARMRSQLPPGMPPVVELRADWQNWSEEEQREGLRSVVGAVFVGPASGPLTDRVRVVPAWDLNGVQLPGRGVRGYVPTPWLMD